MTRSKKLRLNTISSLINQLVIIICGFILPRFILRYYGSSVNGLISSIQQLLGLIGFCELGVGAVVQSALYKPLADGDNVLTSKILISAKRFFNKIGIVLTIYVIILAVFFPFRQRQQFEYLSTFFLIVAMSISFFAQYFFGVRDQLLINADQRSYIQLFYQSITVILNTIISVFIIKRGASIQIVKLTTSIIYLIRPIGLAIYVKRHYKIDFRLKFSDEPIVQKWNGIAQHLAFVVVQNTDTVVLTFFSTLTSVSIYNVYYLVVSGVKQIIVAITTGMEALLGNLLMKNEEKLLIDLFNSFEWLLHTFVILLFTITGILIVPFVRVYTNGINDANYIVPVFAVLLTCANAMYCIRLPYNIVVKAAGHYKQTQISAIIEMVLNVVVSIVLVFWFDLIGVAIGTLISMLYRTIYYALYLRKNILNRKIGCFVKHLTVDLIMVALMLISTSWLKLAEVNYISWVFMAFKVGTICFIIALIVNLILYRNTIITTFKLFFGKIKSQQED